MRQITKDSEMVSRTHEPVKYVDAEEPSECTHYASKDLYGTMVLKDKRKKHVGRRRQRNEHRGEHAHTVE